MRIGRLLTVLCIALMGAVSLASAQPAPSPTHTARVAIANASRIFNDMQETKALRETLEAKRKKLVADEQQMRAEIQGLMDQLASTNPKHPKWREIRDTIDIKKANMQAWGVATKAAVDRDQKEMVKNLYDKIEDAVGQVAKQNGIDIVIADGRQEIANLDDIPPEELRRLLNSRNVLFATKEVDITEKAITLLDANFAKPAVGAGSPPALPK